MAILTKELSNYVLLTIKVNFSYMIDSFTLWHARLGYIGASMTKRMLKCYMISYKVNDAYKSKIYVKSKMIKKTFQSVNRTSHILELTHSDIFEFNSMLSTWDILLCLYMVNLDILIFI